MLREAPYQRLIGEHVSATMVLRHHGGDFSPLFFCRDKNSKLLYTASPRNSPLGWNPPATLVASPAAKKSCHTGRLPTLDYYCQEIPIWGAIGGENRPSEEQDMGSSKARRQAGCEMKYEMMKLRALWLAKPDDPNNCRGPIRASSHGRGNRMRQDGPVSLCVRAIFRADCSVLLPSVLCFV